MRCHVGAIVLIGVSFVMVGTSKAQFKSTTSIPRSSTLSSQDDVLSPEMSASRKAALETQLDALERSNTMARRRALRRMTYDAMTFIRPWGLVAVSDHPTKQKRYRLDHIFPKRTTVEAEEPAPAPAPTPAPAPSPPIDD